MEKSLIEFAKSMRENAVRNKEGNIICTVELWEDIARKLETVAEYISVREGKNIVADESRKKPPLGVKPGFIAYAERIRELLGAVERNFEHMKTCCMTSEERLGQLHRISAWLQEAILLTHLMGKLNEREAKK